MFFTDPVRTPDPERVAAGLPRCAVIVFRTFGAADAEARALRLKTIARRRGLKLLIAQDAELACRIGADGVHLPERFAARAGALRRAHPGWLVTSAAHSIRAARASRAQAVVISPAFPSTSPSAGAAIGPARLAAWARAIQTPAYALGGLNVKTAGRARMTGVIGFAAVEGLAG